MLALYSFLVLHSSMTQEIQSFDKSLSTVSESKREHLSLIPPVPNPKWPPWAIEFLEARLLVTTDKAAAAAVNRSYQSIYEACLRYSDLEVALQRVREYQDRVVVALMEEPTIARAIQSDPADRMSGTLAMFHLKARDEKYRDKQALRSPVINIVFGAGFGEDVTGGGRPSGGA